MAATEAGLSTRAVPYAPSWRNIWPKVATSRAVEKAPPAGQGTSRFSGCSMRTRDGSALVGRRTRRARLASAGELREVLPHRTPKAKHTIVHQTHDRGRGYHFGDRRQAEDRVALYQR